MNKLSRLLGLAALLSTVLPVEGFADIYDWKHTCSTNGFVTCASVQLLVDGTSVTMRIRNLSSGGSPNSGAGYRNTVFYEIGLLNVPSDLVAGTGVKMSGPTYTDGNEPSSWVVTGNNFSGNGITFGVSKFLREPIGILPSDDFEDEKKSKKKNASDDFLTRIANGIANNCLDVHSKGTPLWMTASCGKHEVRDQSLNDGWVELKFSVNSSWDPSRTEIVIRGVDDEYNHYELSTGDLSTKDLVVVTPEPATILLVLTGLAGLGGARRLRRRRSQQE